MRRRSLISIVLLHLLFFFSGCAGLYFRDAGKPPPVAPQYTLSQWPYAEYWTGIVFNGAKIGFSHFTLSAVPSAADLFEIRSDAALHFRLLSFDKKIKLKSRDRVGADLALKQFEYDYDLDGNRMQLSGRLEENRLEVRIVNRDEELRETLAVESALYPTSIINLYPLLHGLEIGRAYTYMVYDGETRSISPVEQKILAYETSDLFSGKAYKIESRLHGQTATTWMDARGRPLLEMSLGGVVISELESRSAALKYLAQAAVNKDETLLDFSRIQSNRAIEDPRQVRQMEVVLSGIEDTFSVPDDHRQRCRRQGREIVCRIQAQAPDPESSGRRAGPAGAEQYLLPSYIIPSNNVQIRAKAQEIVMQEDRPGRQVFLLVDWIRQHIAQEPVDVFSALDVLIGRKAECQGHAFLYAAFARALSIPTRVVNGIVYSDHYQGFLYHTWAESLLGGRWTAVDPTFGQVPADATHVKLIEGENMSDLIPLVDLIGKIQLRIFQIDSADGS